MYAESLYPSSRPQLLELPARKEVESRFTEFKLPRGSTIESALNAVADRYDSLGGDSTSYARVIELLENIAETNLHYSEYPAAGIAREILINQELTAKEIEAFSKAVWEHDQEISAALARLREWVEASTTDDIGNALNEGEKIWGVFPCPEPDVRIVVTCKTKGSIYDFQRVPVGLYYCKETERGNNSVGFAIDDARRLQVKGSSERTGKTLLRAEDQALYCHMPYTGEGDMPPNGTLLLLLPGEERTITVPLRP